MSSFSQELLEKALEPPKGEEQCLDNLIEALAKEDADEAYIRPIARLLAQKELCEEDDFVEQVKNKKEELVKEEILANTPPTEDELMERYIELHPDTVYGLGNFRRFENGYYKGVPDEIVRQEISEILIEAKHRGIKPTNRKVISIAELLRYRLFVNHEKWNADREHLVLENGLLNFRTRELKDHNPSLYFTSGIPISYDPDEKAPRFEKFMQRIDRYGPGTSKLIQQFFGNCLTFNTSQEKALWLWGPPGSGKSTLIKILNAVLEERCVTLTISDLQGKYGTHKLIDATVAVATEQPVKRIRETAKMNEVISGDIIHVEKKFKDQIKIIPTVKIVWAMNELPQIDSNDGLFRRLLIIKFPHLIEENRDIRLLDKLLEELPGILNWMLDGLEDLENNGGYYEIPETVKKWNEEFKTENDSVGQFIQEMCNLDSNGRVQASHFQEAYEIWCAEKDLRPLTSKERAKDMRQKGYEQIQSNGRYYWLGLKLKE